MTICERIKKFLKYNSNELITDDLNTLWAPIDKRWYKIALVYTKVRTIIAIVVESDEDAAEIEQTEDFIKWITDWIEVKL